MSKIFLPLILSLAFSSVFAQQEAIQRFLKTPALRHASVGISVIRLADGKEVAAWQPDRSMVPASTLKALTTATSIRLLGASYRIPTTVAYTGEINNSLLTGSLIIEGNGDPSLGSRYDKRGRDAFFSEMTDALRKAGIRKIAGGVIGDDRKLPEEGVMPGWLWEDLGNYYAAGIYGLNYGDNMFEIVLNTSRKGQQPTVARIKPEIKGLKINNRLLDRATTSDSAYIYGAPYEPVRYIYGAVPHTKAEFTIKGDLPNPPLQTAQFATDYLRAQGIACSCEPVSGRQLEASGDGLATARKELLTYYSQPLSNLIRQTNLYSLNLYAEGLLRQLSPRAPAAIQRMLRYWEEQGLDTGGLFLYDGSGLSPSNRITAGFLSNMMLKMKDDEAFVASLPLAGTEGTVRSFLQGTPYAGKARLKSGYIKQVIGYTGYIEGKQKYAVTVLVNNASGSSRELRKAIEKLLTEMNL